jgi:hypothetical protein
MANILGILGGVGQGVSAGVQDLERMDEAKFRKEQQQRERERIAEERRLEGEIKGIQSETPAEYDESMSVVTKPAQKLTNAQLLAKRAAVYQSSPDRQSQMYGLQLGQAAKAEESSDKLKAIQAEHEANLAQINKDPNKWVQENLAKFNSDEVGGPGSKGFVAAPMSTAQGTVLNVYDPQGRQAHQIPINKQAMMQTARAMYFDKLSSVNPEYAKLAMQNEELDIKRKAGESDAAYKQRVGDYHQGQLGLDTRRLDAQIRGGMLSRAPERFEALGLGDNGRTIFGTRGGVEATLKVPEGFEGSFPKLQPKSTRPAVAKVVKDDEGNTVALSAEGRPLHNIVSGGLEVPLGVTNSDWTSMKKKADSAGIQVSSGRDKDGAPVIAYRGKDGEFYSTLEEARKAKAK